MEKAVATDANEIKKAVLRNIEKLRGCEGPHSFRETEWLDARKTMPKRFQCSRCGGEVGVIEHRWYLRGLEHAAKSNRGPEA